MFVDLKTENPCKILSRQCRKEERLNSSTGIHGVCVNPSDVTVVVKFNRKLIYSSCKIQPKMM